MRTKHNNDMGRNQHIGVYIVCYRFVVSVQRIRVLFQGHPTVTIELMGKDMVCKDYSTSPVPRSLRQKVGHKVYYLNIEDSGGETV